MVPLTRWQHLDQSVTGLLHLLDQALVLWNHMVFYASLLHTFTSEQLLDRHFRVLAPLCSLVRVSELRPLMGNTCQPLRQAAGKDQHPAALGLFIAPCWTIFRVA